MKRTQIDAELQKEDGSTIAKMKVDLTLNKKIFEEWARGESSKDLPRSQIKILLVFDVRGSGCGIQQISAIYDGGWVWTEH